MCWVDHLAGLVGRGCLPCMGRDHFGGGKRAYHVFGGITRAGVLTVGLDYLGGYRVLGGIWVGRLGADHVLDCITWAGALAT